MSVLLAYWLGVCLGTSVCLASTGDTGNTRLGNILLVLSSPVWTPVAAVCLTWEWLT